MRLLIEQEEQQIEYLSEDKEGGKHLYISGCFMQSDIANKNKRIYPRPVMENEVNRFVRDVIKLNGGIGELRRKPGLAYGRIPAIGEDARRVGAFACVVILEARAARQWYAQVKFDGDAAADASIAQPVLK